MVFFRATYVDFWGVVLCVALMSISSLFYIIGGQFLISKLWHLVPISGYGEGLNAAKFLVLPVIIGVVSGAGANTRWYRTIFLEEMGKDYVRTARAKGLPESIVLFRHVLRNALIPILTGAVVVIPLLFLGSLIAGIIFWYPRVGQLYHRRDQFPGFRCGTRHGFSRIPALYHWTDIDRHFLYAG